MEELCSLPDVIDQSVVPGHQGGPHNYTILSAAVALKQASASSFKEYQELILENARALAVRLVYLGYQVDSPNHHLVVKLGAKDVQLLKHTLQAAGVTSEVVVANNELHVGTPAMTSRGFLPRDFRWVAGIIHSVVEIGQELKNNDRDSMGDGKQRDTSWKSLVETGRPPSVCRTKINE